MRYPIGRLTLVFSCTVILMACTPKQEATSFASLLNVEGKQVTPGKPINLPEDHQLHPEYGIEWWYLTANLQTEQQVPIWIQWTLFRIKAGDGQEQQAWSNSQLYMAHAVINTQQQKFKAEKFARGGVGNAGFAPNPHTVFIDDWQLQGSQRQFPASATATLQEDSGFQLSMHTDKAPIVHGDQGYSLKYPGTNLASYYYSQPFLTVTGQVKISGESMSVSGNAWFDHEWSSAFLSDDFTGWQWFAMHLQDNQKLMLFTLVSKSPDIAPMWSGTFVDASGNQHNLVPGDIAVHQASSSTIKGKQIPTMWQVVIPKHNIELTATTKKKDQFNEFTVAYYEGAITIEGSHKGVGFIEMTGY